MKSASLAEICNLFIAKNFGVRQEVEKPSSMMQGFALPFPPLPLPQSANVTKCQIKLHEKPSLVPVLSCFLSSASAFSELARPESYENIVEE